MSLNGKITHRGPCTTLCLSLCPSHSLCRTRNIIYDFDSLLKNLMECVGEVVVGESLDSRSHMQFMHTQTTLSNLTACQKPEKNSKKKTSKKRIIKAFTGCNCTENCQFYLSLSPRCVVLLFPATAKWKSMATTQSHSLAYHYYAALLPLGRGDLYVFYIGGKRVGAGFGGRG